MLNRPYAESCDQNQEPILQVLHQFMHDRKSLLEIGSGTGQHAVYFGQKFPWLSWQTSDLADNHSGIRAWIEHSQLKNVAYPVTLDVAEHWPVGQYDVVFSANTLHIMSSESVTQLFKKLPACMHDASLFIVYGPFNYQGEYTSESNRRFDGWLKQRDAQSGIKNFEWLQDIAGASGLECSHDFEMPANNRILVWQKHRKIH